ncbi:MAG: hypothetical protein J6X88_08960 [Bacteroidales bacterium]|nr:hypothetical protein [Bacteroidales bacterium]
MTCPIYIIECVSQGCSYEIRVNDVWAFSEYGDENVSLQFPINNLILQSGVQTLSIIIHSFLADGQKKTSLSISLERYDVDLQEMDLPQDPASIIHYNHIMGSPNVIVHPFTAIVPYHFEAWSNSTDLTKVNNLPSLVLQACNGYHTMIKEGHHEEFFSIIENHDNLVATSLYWNMTKEQQNYRKEDFLGLLQDGYNFSFPSKSDRLVLYGYSHLVRYVKQDGTSAITLHNDETNDNYSMDLYFHLPEKQSILQLI